MEVQTHNISRITDEMYLNALMTAGVKDAKVYVTAPFEVSGTAALTGLMKAYETTSGEKISEDVKKVANEEPCHHFRALARKSAVKTRQR